MAERWHAGMAEKSARNEGNTVKPHKNSKLRKRKDERTNIKSAVETVRDYSLESSIHGLSYLGNRNHSGCGRVFWMLTVLLALGCTSNQVFQIWSQWLDKPVETTLDTISLPVEEIDFPAVTLCPQGSTADIMDKFLFHQFEEWFIRKIDKDVTKFKREKREGGSSVCECHVAYFGNMTREDLQCCFKHFLDEVYPGVYPNNPTEIASMLTAVDPEKAIETKAVILPEDENNCDENDEYEILNRMNLKLNHICPEPYKSFNDSTCVIEGPSEATYSEALMYCKEQGGANLFYMDAFEGPSTLDRILGKLFEKIS